MMIMMKVMTMNKENKKLTANEFRLSSEQEEQIYFDNRLKQIIENIYAQIDTRQALLERCTTYKFYGTMLDDRIKSKLLKKIEKYIRGKGFKVQNRRIVTGHKLSWREYYLKIRW